MVVNALKDTYKGRRVLVTGNTGFKGSWLTLWLQQLGAEICCVSYDPVTPRPHWEMLGLDVASHQCDICDYDRLASLFLDFAPEVVFHLAAQPLVLTSYEQPLATWNTNLTGTLNVLEASRETPSVRAIVAVTTDKVYKNDERRTGYSETDRLGGHDPYSASKAAAEILIESYRKSFFHTNESALLASVRAGNVIGGGDWGANRLIPDVVRAMERGEVLQIRSPNATRPWQHVLDCLSGYLLVGQQLLAGDATVADAWNFGPEAASNVTVGEVLSEMKQTWSELSWEVSTTPTPHESGQLFLDCTKAREQLGWVPVWGLTQALQQTTAWYRDYKTSGAALSLQQLEKYVADAAKH